MRNREREKGEIIEEMDGQKVNNEKKAVFLSTVTLLYKISLPGSVFHSFSDREFVKTIPVICTETKEIREAKNF